MGLEVRRQRHYRRGLQGAELFLGVRLCTLSGVWSLQGFKGEFGRRDPPSIPISLDDRVLACSRFGGVGAWPHPASWISEARQTDWLYQTGVYGFGAAQHYPSSFRHLVIHIYIYMYLDLHTIYLVNQKKICLRIQNSSPTPQTLSPARARCQE